MKLLSTGAIIIIVFSVLCAVIIFPPQSDGISGIDENGTEFLGIPISEKTVRTSEKTVREIAELGALTIPRPIRYVFSAYAKPFSIIGDGFSSLYKS